MVEKKKSLKGFKRRKKNRGLGGADFGRTKKTLVWKGGRETVRNGGTCSGTLTVLCLKLLEGIVYGFISIWFSFRLSLVLMKESVKLFVLM